MTSFKTTQVADKILQDCMFLMKYHEPCKHKLLVTHVDKGVEITCKLCNTFTVYTSKDDVARVVEILGRK